MNLVKQKFDWDCGVAALAMAANKSYDDVIKFFESENKRVGRMSGGWKNKTGLVETVIEWYLKENGFWMQKAYKIHFDLDVPPWQNSDSWPPEPWGNSHIIQINQLLSGRSHYICMDSIGNVYDPLKDKICRLRDYNNINFILGVCKSV